MGYSRVSLVHSLLCLLYPAYCLHCRRAVDSFDKLLCSTCIESLVWISHYNRCSKCFLAHDVHYTICDFCKFDPPQWDAIGVCFANEGAWRSVEHALVSFPSYRLFRLAASFLYVRLEDLKWPLPDVVTFNPLDYHELKESSHNKEIAKELAHLMQRPLVQAIIRTNNVFWSPKHVPYIFDSKANIRGKTVLIVDTKLKTGATLNHWAREISKGHPSSIYILSLCLT